MACRQGASGIKRGGHCFFPNDINVAHLRHGSEGNAGNAPVIENDAMQCAIFTFNRQTSAGNAVMAAGSNGA